MQMNKVAAYVLFTLVQLGFLIFIKWLAGFEIAVLYGLGFITALIIVENVEEIKKTI